VRHPPTTEVYIHVSLVARAGSRRSHMTTTRKANPTIAIPDTVFETKPEPASPVITAMLSTEATVASAVTVMDRGRSVAASMNSSVAADQPGNSCDLLKKAAVTAIIAPRTRIVMLVTGGRRVMSFSLYRSLHCQGLSPSRRVGRP
jgi:hypothetical protein